MANEESTVHFSPNSDLPLKAEYDAQTSDPAEVAEVTGVQPAASDQQDTSSKEPTTVAPDSGTPAVEKPLAGKFKNVAELEKGYLNATRRLGKSQSELKEVRTKAAQAPERSESSTQDAGQQSLSGDQDPALNILRTTIADAVRAEVAPVRDIAIKQQVRAEIAELQQRHPDADVSAITKVFDEFPEIALAEDALEKAYKLSRAESIDSVVESAKQEGRAETLRAEQTKTVTSGTLSAARATERKATGGRLSQEDFSKLSLAEKEQYISENVPGVYRNR